MTTTLSTITMLIASTLLVLLSVLPTTYSQPLVQPLVPISVEQFAFARAGPKAYMIGGVSKENDTVRTTSGQVFSLDLSVSWKTSSPPWKALASVAPVYFIHAVAAPDNQSIIVIKRGVNESLSYPIYRIITNLWDANPANPMTVLESRQGIKPVIDPLTWNIYMNAWTNLDVYNTNTSTYSYYPMPPNTFTSRFFAGSCYNAARRSIMYYGGLNGTIKFDPAATYISEYSIAAQQWSNFTATGTPPEPRSDFCMTASEDGNKVVVFGGRIEKNMTATPPVDFTGSFYILDVVARTWTRAPDSSLRSYMGCLIIGNQFLVWGGSDGNNTLPITPIVFDFTLNRWVDSYTAPDYYLNPAKTTSKGANPTSPSTSLPATALSESNNLGAILGGTFGALFVIAVSAMVYLFLKRREDKIKYGTPSDQQDGHEEYDEKPASADNSSQRNPHHVQRSDGRDPQDISGLVYKNNDTTSHLGQAPKDVVYPVGTTHAFGTAPMGAPTMLVPNPSFISVAGNNAFVQPNQAYYTTGPNNQLYQVYNNHPAGHVQLQGQGMQSTAPAGAFVTTEGQPLMISYGTPVYTLPIDPSGLGPQPVGFTPPFAQATFANSNNSSTTPNGSPTHAYPPAPPTTEVASSTLFSGPVTPTTDRNTLSGSLPDSGQFNTADQFNTTGPVTSVGSNSNNFITASLPSGGSSPNSSNYTTATVHSGPAPSLASLPPRPTLSNSNLLSNGNVRSSPLEARNDNTGYVRPPASNPIDFP
ncbi:hypothetical protein BGX33_007609 [Mortierella sp. NVP41]|nr:hypothetical protein BGX33_007609 [Mortierella sp. NVP41]